MENYYILVRIFLIFSRLPSMDIGLNQNFYCGTSKTNTTSKARRSVNGGKVSGRVQLVSSPPVRESGGMM